MGYGLKDTALKVTKALPNGATTATSTAIDLGHGLKGDFVAPLELKLSAPALTTVEAPDTKTFTYNILTSDNADLSDPTTVVAAAIVQTGAGGAGAAANTYTWRPNVDVKRYVFVTCVGVATGAGSTASLTLEALL